MEKGPLSVCLVLDDRMRRYYHYKEIETLVEDKNIHVSKVLIDADSNVNPYESSMAGASLFELFPIFAKNLFRREFMALIHAERWIAQQIKPSSTVAEELRELERRVDVFSIEGLDESTCQYFSPKKVGKFTYEFPDDLVDEVSETCDVVVLLGFTRIIQGRILTEPKYGALSFHGADIRRYRGRPSAYFQYLNGDKTIGITLQQLTEELDGGKIILCKHADISEVRSWRETRLQIEKMYGKLLVEGLNKLTDPDFEPTAPEELGTLTYMSEGHELKNVLRCLGKNIQNRYLRRGRKGST